MSPEEKKRTPLHSRPLRFLDIETLGLGESDPIVEIGILDEKGSTVLHSYVRPGPKDPLAYASTADPIALEWSGYLTASGTVSDRFLKAPLLLELAPALHQALDGCQVWGYSVWFDVTKIRTQLRQLGWEVGRLGLPCFGVETLAAEHLPFLEGFSLRSVCEALGIDSGARPHTALPDADRARRAYLDLIRADALHRSVLETRAQQRRAAQVRADGEK